MLQTLLGLKKAASGHAAALAAEDRGRFENKVQWEMQRLNQEIQTLAQRLRECSKEVAAVDSAATASKWLPSTPCLLLKQSNERERQRQFSHKGGPGRRPVTGCKAGDAGERGKWVDECKQTNLVGTRTED